MTPIPYLKSKSATLLWLIKLAAGLFAAYYIFKICQVFLPAIRTITRQSGSFSENVMDYFKNMLGYAELNSDLLKEFGSDMPSVSISGLWSNISTIAMLIYIVMVPILTVLDAVGATLLRFKEKGTGLIKVVHGANAAAAMIMVVDTIVMIVFCIKNRALFEKEFLIAAVIIFAVIALIFLLVFCYHKDIVRAMSAVNENIIYEGGWKMKKTHLSGLAFLSGVFWFIMLIGTVSLDMKISDKWISILVVFIFMVKQFLVIACNRGLKKYNR